MGALVDDFGIDAANSHDTLADAMACAGVFFALLDLPVSAGRSGR